MKKLRYDLFQKCNVDGQYFPFYELQTGYTAKQANALIKRMATVGCKLIKRGRKK